MPNVNGKKFPYTAEGKKAAAAAAKNPGMKAPKTKMAPRMEAVKKMKKGY